MSKIDLEASERLSELSELEEQVNILEPQKNSLEAKIEGLRNEIEQLGSISDNSTRIYPVSKSGSGGQSVSGSFELPKKAKTAGISGVAYGPGGIQISIPTID